jgi:hypothetical protein
MTGETEHPTATVRESSVRNESEDSEEPAFFRAMGKLNCCDTFRENLNWICYIRWYMSVLDYSPSTKVILLANVDDLHGAGIAGFILPGYPWQEIRDRGQVPFARELARRDFMLEALEVFDQEAAAKLARTIGTAVVVIDYGVAEIFPF